MSGTRAGIGGSSSAKDLAATLGRHFFPEIWQVRDLLTTGYGG